MGIVEHVRLRLNGIGRDLIARAVGYAAAEGWRRLEVTAPDLPR